MRLDLGHVRHVGLHDDGLAAERLDLGLDALGFRPAVRWGAWPSTRCAPACARSKRDGPADALRGSRDDGDLVLQAKTRVVNVAIPSLDSTVQHLHALSPEPDATHRHRCLDEAPDRPADIEAGAGDEPREWGRQKDDRVGHVFRVADTHRHLAVFEETASPPLS